jgi:DNA polymerase-3 subunit gamma/tau
MSYLVLARKWRPKKFADMVGQEHVLQALTNALQNQKLHHAYLFAGTRGVGKTTIARIFAKSLNCESGITAEPCGECGACAEIDEGRFVDLIEVDAASRTKVDDTRELLDNVQYSPARGRFKVYLIDEVHMLSRNSFNALLKTLEEPPPHVKFLLATTDPQKLPVTVLSRCLQFNLKRLPPKLIQGRLEHICKAESVKSDPAALARLARAADGSLRDALSLLDQSIAFGSGTVKEADVALMLGTIDQQHVARILERLAREDGQGLMQVVAEIDEQFPDYGRLLDDLARTLQRVAVYQVVGASDLDDEYAEANLAELADKLNAADVQLFYQTALTGKRDLGLAPDPRSGVEMTLLRMLAFKPAGAGGAVPAGGAAAKKTPATPKKAPAARPASGSKQAAKAEVRAWQDPDWVSLLERLPVGGAVRMLASNCAYVRREENTILFSLDSRSESLLTRQRSDAIAEALSSYFGETLMVQIIVSAIAEAETPVQRESRLDDEKLAQAKEALESDPNVRALKDMFGAELKADSVKSLN